MLADFFTKPLQGKLFKYLREIIMGSSPLTPPLTLEERVENHGSINKKGDHNNNMNKLGFQNKKPILKTFTLINSINFKCINSLVIDLIIYNEFS